MSQSRPEAFGDPDVADPTRSSSTGKTRPVTEKQRAFIDDLHDRCQVAGAEADDWSEMQRRAGGFQAASRQIDALLAIEEASKDAHGEESRGLAAAGVEDAREGRA